MTRIRRRLALVAAACAGMMLHACDESGTAVSGGSAVEGETVAARLLDAEGHPVPGAKVHATVDTPIDWSFDAVSDSAGRISIRVPSESKQLVLSLESPDLPGRILTFRIVLRPSLDTSLVLDRWGSLSGVAIAPAGWVPRSVLMPGVGLRDSATGVEFGFPHVPPGIWPLLLVADSAGVLDTFDLGAASMPPGGTDVQQTFSVRRNAILSLSFDDTATTRLPRCLRADTVAPACAEYAVGSSAWSNSSLRAHLVGTSAAQASIRLQAGADSATPLAATIADTLALVARGTGLVRIVLGIASGDSTIASAPLEIDLRPTWTAHSSTLGVLLPGRSGNIAIRWISIASPEETWLVLDEVRILGNSRSPAASFRASGASTY